MFVDPKYKINIYLDTNILVDYALATNQTLNQSLSFLAHCDFVVLQSSRYVEFELTEVLKYNIFYFICYGFYPNNAAEKSKIKKSWKISGLDYSQHSSEVENMVNISIQKIRDELSVKFDTHPLEDNLLTPTQQILLSTKISREDSLMLVSGAFPIGNIDYCLLLSNDSQFVKESFMEKENIDRVLQGNGLRPLQCHCAKKLCGTKNQQYNLYKQDLKMAVIESLWTSIIIQTLKVKLADKYIGETYKYSHCGAAASCVFFQLKDELSNLPEHSGLVIIDKSLKWYVSLPRMEEYRNNDKIVTTLPNENNIDGKYSFRCPDKYNENLAAMQQKGHLVIINDD